jgi:hypothetical protein
MTGSDHEPAVQHKLLLVLKVLEMVIPWIDSIAGNRDHVTKLVIGGHSNINGP